MVNPFLNLPTFTTNPQNQYDFFEGLKTILNDLDEIEPISIESLTSPTQTTFVSAYLAAGNSLPIPTNQDFIWTKLGVPQALYRPIDDYATSILDLRIFNSSTLPSSGSAVVPTNIGDFIVQIRSSGLHRLSVNGAMTLVVPISDSLTGNTPLKMSVSPDLTKIVYVLFDGGNINLRVAQASTPGVSIFDTTSSSSTYGIGSPSWSGNRIAFVRETVGGGSWRRLCIMDDDGTDEVNFYTLVSTTQIISLSLSPDQSRVVYFTHTGVGSGGVLSMVNVDGTGNTVIKSSITSQVVIVDWIDNDHIMYGNKMINVDTLIETYWSEPIDTSDDVFLTDEYDPLRSTKYWFGDTQGGIKKYSYDNIMTVRAPVIVNNRQQAVGFLGSGVGIVAIPVNGSRSTGIVYRISDYVPDRSDFELIKHVTLDGSTTSILITEAELQGFDHLMIFSEAHLDTNATINGQLIFNNDATAGNYQNTNILSQNTTVRGYQSMPTDSIRFYVAGNSTHSDVQVMTIFDIQSTDNFKQVFNDGLLHINGVAYSATSQYSGHQIGIWKSTAAIQSIALVFSTAPRTGSRFSFYGLRGRMESDEV